ncbi:MAG: SDR family oxidoreductase [Ilumatobacter sp.]|uniref:SDR family oxidoreductase n=1 Tax=Ilumatobacter sp. TaxID=1967498 RepID=UPI00391C4085
MTTKTVLITGASSGIGHATAQHFHQHGWNVVATMRTPDDSELHQLDNTLVTRLDVTDIDSIDTAVQAALDRFGGIDVLVNNAGYDTFGPLEAVPRDAMVRQIDTNLVGVLDVTRAVLPTMRTRGEGVVINISSVAGQMTFPFNSLYHATKFGLEGATESLAFELGGIGIRVKIIQPGSIATQFWGGSLDFHDDPDLAEYRTMMDAISKAVAHLQENHHAASPPSVVAEVIYRAATDGTDTIRYRAGDNADAFFGLRDGKTDEEYIAATRQQYGISPG